jgi:cytosine deaminase
MSVGLATEMRQGWYTQARVPAALAHGLHLRDVDAGQGLALVDFGITQDGMVSAAPTEGPRLDLGGRLVLPTFIDSHVHLDKAFIVQRTGLPQGGLLDAVKLSGVDAASWTEADLEARMTRALERAFANGTSAMRTHLDTPDMPHDSAAWKVFDRVRTHWAGRIELQAVALMALDRVDHTEFAARCRQIAGLNGILGAFIAPGTATPERLDALFIHATAAGLDVDFHVDETLDPAANAIELICDSVLRTGFAGAVMAGHCCSLSSKADADRDRIIDKIAQAGVNIVSLPHSNLFLQDRAAGATPKRRGITQVRELRARGAQVHFASDNVQDPFYPYGDFDMLDVMRSAIRVAHLDVDVGAWATVQMRNAAAACGLRGHGQIEAGTPADLIILDARDWHDLVSRSLVDRVVLRSGTALRAISGGLHDLFGVRNS